MPIRNPFREDSNVLRDASRKGLVNTRLCLESVPFRMMRYLGQSRVARSPINNVDENAQALHNSIHTFGRYAVLDPNLDHLLELARIEVPEGNIGHLRHIEQYLADSEGLFNATASQYWGMPYFETMDIDDIIWLFRIDNYVGLKAPRFYQNAVAMPDFRSLLPGRPWWDLPEFNGIWYPAVNSSKFHGSIPSGHQLRFFVYVPQTVLSSYSWRPAGRLSAQIQNEQCREAIHNSRILA